MIEDKQKEPKKRALGRGLSSLIPQDLIPSNKKDSDFFLCPIEKIKASIYQPRVNFAEDKIDELAKSIKAQGIIQPIVVRKLEDKYEVVAGERRLRAAQKAGIKEVPVIVKDINKNQALELALVENLQRDDLNPLEQAQAFDYLISNFNYTQQQIAESIGKDRSTIANLIRLLSLPDEIKKMINDGSLKEGHARTLLALNDKNIIINTAKEIIEYGLSVRETEEYVKKILDSVHNIEDVKEVKETKKTSPHIKEIINNLQRNLGTKIDLKDKKGKGKIVIFYYSYEELDRVLDKINKI